MNFEDRLLRFWGQSPKVPASAFIAQGAGVIGDVTLGAEAAFGSGRFFAVTSIASRWVRGRTFRTMQSFI